MQLLLCIDVIANPKNSELLALCKWWEGRRRDESRLYKGRSQKRSHSHSVHNICFIRGDVCDGLRLRIPWIAEISDAIDLRDAYQMRWIPSLEGIAAYTFRWCFGWRKYFSLLLSIFHFLLLMPSLIKSWVEHTLGALPDNFVAIIKSLKVIFVSFRW